MKRKLSILLVITFVITMFGGMGAGQIPAKAKKVNLSTKKVTVYKGKKKTIKVKNAKKKVKWKIKNKKVAKVVKKSGKYKNTVKIKGLKKGSTKILATCGNKKLTAKVVVKVNKSNTSGSTNTNTPGNSSTNTSEKETNAKESKIVGKVTNTSLKCYDKVYFEYVLEGDSDAEYIYGMAPGKLEILENGAWRELKKKPLKVIDIAGLVSNNSKGSLVIKLYDAYEGLKEGHYKYTHTFSGIEVPVEFDIFL